MVQLGNHKNSEIEENMVRHMVLNSIRAILMKYKHEYGKLVIACDSKNYWRKQVFPYYKANRKKSQQASEYDWQSIFACINKIREELKESFPYCIIEIETAEADDIISSLCKKYGNIDSSDVSKDYEKILILSADKDFIQLHKYINVDQYDFIHKKSISHPNPKHYLYEHIMKGDVGDGIPNILSDDNCFVIGKRQSPLRQTKIDEFITDDIENNINHKYYRNFIRNKQLIDLTQVPDSLYHSIIESYNDQQNKSNKNLINYFIKHKLKNLMESLGDFV
jgi:hypothetical protein